MGFPEDGPPPMRQRSMHHGSVLSWIPIVLDPYCPRSLLSHVDAIETSDIKQTSDIRHASDIKQTSNIGQTSDIRHTSDTRHTSGIKQT